jgi:hypothetical protein
MIAYQAVKATLYMLLAKAREPIGASELVPATSPRRPQQSTGRPSAGAHVRLGQMGRRQTDSPLHRASPPRRLWDVLSAWVVGRVDGAQR